MAYQILKITPLKKGFDVLVDLGFRHKRLFFRDQKTFDLEFPSRMAQAELNVQADLDQKAFDALHPTYYSREDMHNFLVERNMIREDQTVEDLPTKNAILARLTDYEQSEVRIFLNKLFGTNW